MSAPRPPFGGTESRSINIATPPAALWALLTLTADIADWYDDWDTVEHDPGDEHLGLRAAFRLIRWRHGHLHTAQCRVTVLDPPHRLAWIEDHPPRPATLVDFHLEPGPGGDTVLTLSKTF